MWKPSQHLKDNENLRTRKSMPIKKTKDKIEYPIHLGEAMVVFILFIYHSWKNASSARVGVTELNKSKQNEQNLKVLQES